MANYKITKRTRKDKDGNVLDTYDCIIADFENMTRNEKEAVELYMKAGYKVFPKTSKKATGKGITRDKIKEYLKDYNDNISKDIKKRIATKENFMTIQSYFKTIYFEYPEEADIDKVEKRAEYYKNNYKANMTTEQRKAFKNNIENL